MALKPLSVPGGKEALPLLRWLAAAVAVAVLVVLAATAYGRGTLPAEVRDPGALVRWGYGVAQTLQNLAAAATIGALVFAAFILPPVRRPENRDRGMSVAVGAEHPAFTRVMVLAAAAGMVWTVSALAVLVFSFADIAGVPISGSAGFAAQLASYVAEIPNGTAWLWVVIIAACTSTTVFSVRSPAGVAAAAFLSMAGLVPVVLIGHAAGSSDHEQAINSLALHLLGVCLWVGGLIALTVAGTALGKNTQDVLRRFSTLAGSAFILVVASGIINALIRVQTPEDLASPYGALLALKTLGAIGLGVIGYLHRTRVIPLLGLTAGTGASRGLLWRLVGVELLIMGAVSGLAAALARTPTPGGEEIRPALTPAEILTGYLLPPEPAAEQWFTVWRPDWLWITAAAFAAFLYQHAARRLNKRGAGWPWLRSAAWLAGLGLLVFFTSGGPSVYGRVLFSAHALDHMALATIIPVLLVLGAPVTLARRVLAPRVDGSTGPHEWIESVSGSRFAAIVTHPLAAAAVMAASMLLFYSTDAYGFALREHAGHELMSVYFVTVGCLFVLSMLGTGTLGRRFTYPARLAALAATMAFYTVFGITVMRSTVLIQPGWFTELGRDWGLPALQDQQLAGAILWGFGAIPAALMAIAVLIMRSRTLQTRGPGSQPSGASNSSAVPSPEAHP